MSAYLPRSRSATLAAAVSAALAASPAWSQNELDAVIVTATRRTESIQDVPLNIAAVSAEQLQVQGITDLGELGRTIPGLFVLDQGPRAANAIVVRGLNADPIAGTEALGNAGGGTVATYVGEIPLYIDLKPVDIDRVEILLGPQGTLYGAGTLGGAIRYIPMRPQFDASTLELRAEGYKLAESEGLGAKGGFTLNVPIGNSLALRGSVEYVDDPGFIDYNHVVRVPGVSDPEPNAGDPPDLVREEDADYEQTLYGRIGLRWQPFEALDINLTHYHQEQEVGGRTINQVTSYGTGRYESAARYLEPNERRNQLTALELTADLGFAELTSATGYSKYRDFGQRDQTDLLIALQYSYEAFPSFSAFTREDTEEETINQEVRLVSTDEGPFSWIAGAFFNKFEQDEISKEFTPGFSQYNLDVGLPGVLRPDALEYISVDHEELKEYAIYGEASYRFTPRWQVTLGGRWYKYDLATRTAVDLPLLFTTIDPDGRGPNDIVLSFTPGGQEDDGFLFKFNTSFDFTDDLMGYFTVSEGYRIGNSNGVVPCVDTGQQQSVCGQPRELAYTPDTTTNFEVGLRSQWLDRLTLNTSVFYIDWDDPQLTSSTQVGAQPITINGEGAASFGLELSFALRLTDRFEVSGSYGYVEAELTAPADDLIRTVTGTGPTPFDVAYEDGADGDRLPGSPQHQGALFATYTVPVAANSMRFNYGINAVGDVLTRTGARGGGESLGGFTVHSASAVYDANEWSLALYAKNLTNKYAETGARSSTRNVQTVVDEAGNPVRVRAYSKDVLRPREIGLRFDYKFDF